MAVQLDAPHAINAAAIGKFLTFELGPAMFGIPVRHVKEIIGLPSMNAAPAAPDCVAGVIELRGSWIPVVDLRTRFGLDAVEYDEHTCVVIVDTGTPTGLIVDTVHELVDITDQHVHAADPVRTPGGNATIGIWRHHADATILLDVARILGSMDTRRIVQDAAARASSVPQCQRQRHDAAQYKRGNHGEPR